VHACLLTTVTIGLQEAGSIPLYYTPQGIHGGALLGVRTNDFISFYDWATLRCVRRIDVATENVYWNPAGDMLCLTTPTGFFILRFNRAAVAEAFASAAQIDDDGIEDAFEVVTEVLSPPHQNFSCSPA
jgi:coatomer subunit beta'